MNLKSVFKDKTVIVTGHTGFKGSWLTLWLKSLTPKLLEYQIRFHPDPHILKL